MVIYFYLLCVSYKLLLLWELMMLFCVPDVQGCLLMMDIQYLCQTAELHIALSSSVNLFPYRLFIGAIFHKPFNGNHQWCCNPNPFRSLLYSPRRFDGAVVIMSLCECVCVCVCARVCGKVCVCLSYSALSLHYRCRVFHTALCGAFVYARVCLHVCVCVYGAICTIANTALLSPNT